MICLCYTSEMTTQKRENEKYWRWRNIYHHSATEYLRTAYEKKRGDRTTQKLPYFAKHDIDAAQGCSRKI